MPLVRKEKFMIITNKLLKPLKEAKYLNVDNTDRYRPILRLFYLNYEKLKYWMYLEEVYEELKEDDYFSEYTIEQCQQDLSVLVSWGNLNTIQDTRKVTTLEEFKNKKFRYQLSEYAVEIERLAIHLENLFVEGASLEPSLLERIRYNLSRLNNILEEPAEKIYSWWNDLNNDFVRLNQNYQDYMRTLNSVKAEEMMQTREFLVFKDNLIEYLRNFVKGLQQNVDVIGHYIKKCTDENINEILDMVLSYEMSIPRMDMDTDRDEKLIKERLKGRWQSIEEWFVSKNGKEAEAGKVFDITNDIVRKITRYATRISEMANAGANRREEYYKVAQMFNKCNNINEAHRLSAAVFGAESTLHLKAEIERETDSINSGVYEEKPYVAQITPRTRTYRDKVTRTGIIDRTKEKEAIRLAMIEKAERERKLLDSYIKNNRLDFSKLPVIEPYTRDIFLVWLSKALERKDRNSKTEDGRTYYIEERVGETCILECTDGIFTMPSYIICFE